MTRTESIHPGDILLTEYLEPMDISQYRLAKALDVPQTRIADIVKGRRSITADTGLRLSKFFGMSDAFWVNLQAHYDLEVERDRLADALEKVPVYSA